MQIENRGFAITERDGKRYLPAAVLHLNFRADFAIVGYGLSTKGWLDPTEFLVKMRADRLRPLMARLLMAPQARVRLLVRAAPKGKL